MQYFIYLTSYFKTMVGFNYQISYLRVNILCVNVFYFNNFVVIFDMISLIFNNVDS